MAELLLALDPAEFVENSGISISLEEPAQHRLETLRPGAPGAPDAGRVQVNSVSSDPEAQCYRLWYTAFPEFTGDLEFPSHLAYAESHDGIHWEKPDLGLVEYHGDRHNNLLPGIPELCNICSVFRDDDGTYLAALSKIGCLSADMVDDPVLRSQCDACKMEAVMGIIRSSDGLHWHYDGNLHWPMIREKIEAPRLSKVGDHYLLSGQQMRPWCAADVFERMVTFFVSDDLIHWEKRSGFYQAKNHVQSHIGIAVIGTFGNTTLGLSGRFYDAPELPDMAMEVDLVRSHSLLDWAQVAPERAFLRRGPVGAWNGGAILQAQGYIEIGDEMLIYFSGSTTGNCPVNNHTSPGYAKIKRHRFGYAGIQVGWNFLGHAGTRSGTLRTRTLRARPGERLYLNCGNFTAQGNIRTALTDETGRELPGFELCRSRPLKTDGIRVSPTWHGAPPTNALPEKFQLRLEFTGGAYRSQSPRLYAVEVG